MYLQKNGKGYKRNSIFLTGVFLFCLLVSCSEKSDDNGSSDSDGGESAVKTPEERKKAKQKEEVAFSITKMIDVQNEINSYVAMYGRYPIADDVGRNYDAWGNLIEYTYYPSKKKVYDFILYSKGSDKTADTEDDLRIINYKMESAGAAALGSGEKVISSTEELVRNLGDPGDTLNDLDKSEVVYEMSLDQFKENVDNIVGNSVNSGAAVSLEDFKKLQQ